MTGIDAAPEDIEKAKGWKSKPARSKFDAETCKQYRAYYIVVNMTFPSGVNTVLSHRDHDHDHPRPSQFLSSKPVRSRITSPPK